MSAVPAAARACRSTTLALLALGVTAGGAPAVAAAAAATQPAPAPAATPAAPPGDPAARHLPGGRFGTLSVYVPEGRPKSVALFLSGDGGWELGVISMAHALRAARRGRGRGRHPPVLFEPRPGGCARPGLPDDRRGFRDPEPPGTKAARPERVPRAGAGRLLLRRHRGVRHPGAVPTRHVRRRAEPRLLRRTGFRRREPVPRSGPALRAQRAPRAGVPALCDAPAAVDRAAGTEGRGVQRAGRRAIRDAGRTRPDRHAAARRPRLLGGAQLDAAVPRSLRAAERAWRGARERAASRRSATCRCRKSPRAATRRSSRCC